MAAKPRIRMAGQGDCDAIESHTATAVMIATKTATNTIE